jgi:hypothetical protein
MGLRPARCRKDPGLSLFNDRRGPGSGVARARRRARLDSPQQISGSHLLLLCLQDFPQDSSPGGRHFHRDLVGFQLDEGFIPGDRVAHGLEPAQHL